MAKYMSHQDIVNIIGSWHRDGFHGHNRAKSRIEFSNYYRLLAKPSPPEKFKLRVKDDASKHIFSRHDNRQVFLNDPNLFSNGIGKKKIDSVNKSKWDPEFFAWTEEAGRDRLKKTIYQNDFCANSNNNISNNKKLLTGRKNVENRPITVYKSNFAHGEPSVETSKETRAETFSRAVSKNRAKSCVSTERLSVASCMVWHRPNLVTDNNNNNNYLKSTLNSDETCNKVVNFNISENNISPRQNSSE